jgi:glycosyltransferase involved in cell wall biosynthesis
MAEPFFSVIIPVYNRAAALATAIGSVLGQSFQDFEIVVVDDGSRDDPKSVAESFGDPRIRVLRQDNQGGGVARNTAIDAARGRYITPLDSDDIFLPHHLATMKDLLKDAPHRTVGYARMRVDRGRGRVILKPPRALRDGEDMGEYLLCDRGFVPTITVAVAREIARQVRYHPNLRVAEDTDFAIRLQQAGCGFKMAPGAGAVWMDLHDPNRTSSGGRVLRFATWLEQMKPTLTRKAWLGARGWAYAKMVAREGHRWMALRFYLAAVLQGCYRPRLAGVIFLQIFLDARAYRALADGAIAWAGAGLRDPGRAPRKLGKA